MPRLVPTSKIRLVALSEPECEDFTRPETARDLRRALRASGKPPRCAQCGAAAQVTPEAAAFLVDAYRHGEATPAVLRMVVMASCIECGWGTRDTLSYRLVCPSCATSADLAEAEELLGMSREELRDWLIRGRAA